MTRVRHPARFAMVLLPIALAGCVTEPDRPKQAVEDAMVSDVRPPQGALRAPSLRRVAASARMSALAIETDFVYIALPPGRVPDGVSASIRNQRLDGDVVVTMEEGGFDPVQIAATPGDSVIISVSLATGSTTSFRKVVPIRRRPTVVRTSLPRSKTGVPLNMSIRVVFSEPVDRATVTTSTIRLTRGGTPIPGIVRMVDGSELIAAFIPSAPLRADAEHRLEITSGVQDLQGEALERAIPLVFRTGTTMLGAPSMIRVSPDTVEMTTLTYQMTAIVKDAAGNELTDQPIEWATDDSANMTVTQTGFVTALGEGQFNIFATLGSLRANGRVHVSAGPAAVVDVTPSPGLVALGDTLLLTAVTRDESDRRIDRDVTWTSSDPATATVEVGEQGTHTGMVITHRTGSVTITATSGPASRPVVVNVTPPREAATLSLALESATLLANAPTPVVPTVRDVNGREIFARPITWTSQDPTIATVDATGVVRGLRPGTTRITAVSEGLTASLEISIVALAFTAVSAGGSHSCALTVDGAPYCWGSITGNFDLLSRSFIPVRVDTDLAFASLSTGGSFTCGLTAGGRAYCWGSNATAAFGDGTLVSSSSPVAVSGGLEFSALAAGTDHVCALTADGSAYCWGANFEGQIGNGLFGNTVYAFPVAVGGGHKFASLIAGWKRTCGITLDGAALCWGSNELGQLGSATLTSRSLTPIAVRTPPALVSLGSGSVQAHACGVAANAAAYCWGPNTWGQLGDPAAMVATGVNSPVPVSGGLTFSQVGVGSNFTCGLTQTGEAYCWGSNADGRLGIGKGGAGPFNPFDFHAAPVAVAGGIRFATLSVGAAHACGLSTSGVVHCWGAGISGQLGRGTNAVSNVPVKVAGQP